MTTFPTPHSLIKGGLLRGQNIMVNTLLGTNGVEIV